MAARRTLYIIMLLAVSAVQVVANNGVALFLLVALVALPLISLIMLIIVRKTVKFDLVVRNSCIRGGTLQLTMRASTKPRFFVGGVKVLTAIENTTFHKTEYENFEFDDLSFAPHVYDYVGANSGRICVKCDRLKLVDIFGVFSVSVKCAVHAEAIVSPVLYEDLDVRVGKYSNDSLYGDVSLPKKGGDITEIYNIRDYIAGDQLSSVHWKLSGKFDALKSKEFGATDDRRILLLVDMSRNKYEREASDEQLDSVLDVAVSMSHALQTSGCVHSIGWFTDGTFSSSEVCDGDSLVLAIGKLMSVKVNEGNEEDLFYLARTSECAAFTKIIFVSPFVNHEELQQITTAEVTAIEVGNAFGETNNHGVRVISVPYDNIRKAFVSCVI